MGVPPEVMPLGGTDMSGSIFCSVQAPTGYISIVNIKISIRRQKTKQRKVQLKMSLFCRRIYEHTYTENITQAEAMSS